MEGLRVSQAILICNVGTYPASEMGNIALVESIDVVCVVAGDFVDDALHSVDSGCARCEGACNVWGGKGRETRRIADAGEVVRVELVQ